MLIQWFFEVSQLEQSIFSDAVVSKVLSKLENYPVLDLFLVLAEKLLQFVRFVPSLGIPNGFLVSIVTSIWGFVQKTVPNMLVCASRRVEFGMSETTKVAFATLTH